MNNPSPPSSGSLATLDPDTWFQHRDRLTPTRDQRLGGERFKLNLQAEQAVHAALMLGEPLLVTGEPGTGKTTLAWHLAHRLNTPLFEFHTQSISVARDLRYRYDELRRFREAWRAREGEASQSPAGDYVEKGPLWLAIEHANKHGRPPVLLIDEIDKAPRDLPNDLLHDLDQMCFVVPELDRHRVALDPDRQDARPILIITSNEERELPKPFLRRCMSLRMSFDKEVVMAALEARAEELGAPSLGFLELVVRRLWEVRDLAVRKRPATGEALMWARALRLYGVTEERLREAAVRDLPLAELLIKHPADREKILGRE